MITLTLQRDLRTPNETIGWLSFNGRKWPTMERPWAPDAISPYGKKGQSCIQAGMYKLESHDSEAHPKCWALVAPALGCYHWPWEVPATLAKIARTTVLIHPANWASELRGCIAPGKERTKDRSGVWMVKQSRDAVNELRSIIGSHVDVQLLILNPEAALP